MSKNYMEIVEEKVRKQNAIKEHFWSEIEKQEQDVEDFSFTINFSELGVTKEDIEEVLDEMRVGYYKEDEDSCYYIWGGISRMKPDEIMFDLNEDGIEISRYNKTIIIATNAIRETFEGTWEEAIKAAEETMKEWELGR